MKLMPSCLMDFGKELFGNATENIERVDETKSLLRHYPHEVSFFILSLGTSVAALRSVKTAPFLNDGYEYVFSSSQQPMSSS